MKTIITGTVSHDPEKNVYAPEGKNYKVYSVIADIRYGEIAHEKAILKTFSAKIKDAIVSGTLKEFESTYEERVGKNGTKWISYTIAKDALGASSGGGTWQSKYTPRVYLSAKQFHGLCKWCYSIAQELDKEHAPAVFDKILGTASVLLDMSKYKDAEKKPEPQEQKPQVIKQAQEKDLLTVGENEDVYDVGGADVPF